MALAISSGASPDKGLVTAIVAGFVVSLLGGSRVQVGGPTGAFIVVVFSVIAQHGYQGLILATLLAGVILVVAGYAGFGRIIRFVPYPVVTGFTAGIAVIIATAQIKDFFGLRIDKVPAEFIPKLQTYLDHIDTISLVTLAVGLASFGLILGLKSLTPRLPVFLIAVVGAASAVFMLSLPVDTIGSRFPDMPAGLPMPALPGWDFAKLVEIIPSAFTIAFLAGIEALLSATVADGMTGYRHRSDQELVAVGFANITSGLFAGLPATGAIARTAANIKSGGKTPLAGMFHALFLLIFIVFAGKLMGFVPLAALSAILFVVAWNMSEIHHFLHIFRMSRNDRIVMLLTFVLTVFVDLTVGIGVGVTLASLMFQYEMSQANAAHLQQGRVRDSNGDGGNGQAEDPTQRLDLPPGVEVFRLTGPVFFGMTSAMIDTLKSMGARPKVLIVRMKLVPHMDVAGVNAVQDLVDMCRTQGSKIIFTGVQKAPGAMMRKADIVENESDIFVLNAYPDALNLANKLLEADGRAT